MGEQRCCPLCRQMRAARKFKRLYHTPVCRKCWLSFANRRQLAFVLDWLAFQLALLFVWFGIGMALASLRVSNDVETMLGFALGWIAFPMIFYLKDGFRGHSLGKLAVGVQVVDQDTFLPIGPGRSFKRNLPLIIPFAPLIVACLLERGHRWGDGWARTKVIWKRHRSHPVFTGGMTCEGCHYDLTSNTTGVCPECGLRIPNWLKTAGPLTPPITPMPR